jgi:t-SNARE complex subunit (syntaxin)
LIGRNRAGRPRGRCHDVIFVVVVVVVVVVCTIKFVKVGGGGRRF